ncbi:MAG: family 1 glycosylhydrolase [Bacteriovoracaceae bacterium]
MSRLEIWGGIECTLNRVNDSYFDQCEKNGHYQRLEDLDLFAKLNIKKIRYPCLWEVVSPDNLNQFSWNFLDERLEKLRRLEIKPIAGFLHHGSGPRYTDLLDPEFPDKFAYYAKAFIQRFPWIEDFTPINEINTTARFSCLYGHWYPHHKNDQSYLKAIINQCRATILAMKEIRSINPKAKLIQTDDIGKIDSKEKLIYQRDFENERRWLAYDLLCGKVTKKHPLYHFLTNKNITTHELNWFQDNPCPPDVLGVNHYLLSNRFLDDDINFYPKHLIGTNGIDTYADVGSIDTGQINPPQFRLILEETWNRYNIPIVVTEVHTRGHRETQMRWIKYVWEEIQAAKTNGAIINAMTIWSFLGTYDWHNLCTNNDGFYEPGVFDLRNPNKQPAQTAISKLIKQLNLEEDTSSPILEVDGDWTSARRMLWNIPSGAYTPLNQNNVRPLLITGGNGTLAQAFARICGLRNIPYKILTRNQLDISNSNSISSAIDQLNPWAIINAAGYVKVDEAELEPQRCFQENSNGAIQLAIQCKQRDLPLLIFSSDLIFDGKNKNGYLESDQALPLNVYGRSKIECEKNVLAIHSKALIIRTSSFFGPWDQHNFITKTLNELRFKNEIHLANDLIISPTYIPDLVHACLNHLIDENYGVVHVVNGAEVSWYEFINLALDIAAEKFDLNRQLIIPKKFNELKFLAPRPKYSALKSEKFNLLPPLEDALRRYFLELDISNIGLMRRSEK